MLESPTALERPQETVGNAKTLAYDASVAAETMTPTELARTIWGETEAYSRSRGARRVRQVARDLFPRDAPGKGGDWRLTREQAAAIRREV
jgi:hypothetical protein